MARHVGPGPGGESASRWVRGKSADWSVGRSKVDVGRMELETAQPKRTGYTWFDCPCGALAGRFLWEDRPVPTMCWECERREDDATADSILAQVFPDGLQQSG